MRHLDDDYVDGESRGDELDCEPRSAAKIDAVMQTTLRVDFDATIETTPAIH